MATPVPTLGDWGVILLGGLLALLGFSRARRLRR
ncbi:IPTL-CTERM sorting domain-containing protein [Delftia tsuruhatensis]|nr:IPTL-CTERM sorting domain-containing protein [Delftia tsuruhatensis]